MNEVRTTQKHSGGEWTARIAEDQSGDEWEVVAPYPGLPNEVLYVALCPSMGDDCGTPEGNARLIAAAPDLLDAAKEVLAWMNQLPIPTTGCTAKGQLLFDAISKASVQS